MDKRLVNRFCQARKILIGDRNLSRLLKGKVEKDTYFIHEPAKNFQQGTQFNKFHQGRQPKKQTWNNNTTSIIPKPVETTPKEKIVRANCTGLTDEDLFGPAFLNEEPELYVEKKIIPANMNQIRYNYHQKEELYETND